MTAGTAPIADVSYRGYDGPLRTRAIRWWIVALAGIRTSVKRWYFWTLAVFAVLPYVGQGFMLYLASQQGAERLQQIGMGKQAYANYCFIGQAQQGLWLFILAIALGAGTIAADNRSNALLIYLSRPITRVDYLVGKWMTSFLPLYAVSLAPGLIFYTYCLLSYASDGFLKEDPFLILRVLAAPAIGAAVFSSILVGCSARASTGRIAGALFAGLYMVSNIVSNTLWATMFRGDEKAGSIVRHLSLPGAIEGLQQILFNVTIRQGSMHRRRGMELIEKAPPEAWPLLLFLGLLCGLGIWAAWTRIRAVEVVSG